MKRVTSAVITAGLVSLLLLVTLRVAASQENGASTSTTREIKKLQKERVESLGLLLKLAQDRYNGGLESFSSVVDAQSKLVNAQLEFAERPDERIAILEEILHIAKGTMDAVREQAEVGERNTMPYWAARSACLDLQIQLLKEPGARLPAPFPPVPPAPMLTPPAPTLAPQKPATRPPDPSVPPAPKAS